MHDRAHGVSVSGAVDANLGITRRQLLQRSALVGGTLLWTSPVVQTFARPAFAQSASPKDFWYVAFCYRCDTPADNNPQAGENPRCCVKFDLNDDGTVQACEPNIFRTPSCPSFTFDDNDDCGDCGLFDVSSPDGGNTVQVTFRAGVTNCHFVEGQGVGKCGDECVQGDVTPTRITFRMCA